MKPYAQKIGRMDCPRCHSAKCNVFIKGRVRADGTIETAIYEREACSLCFFPEQRKELSTEQIQKVEKQLATTHMKAKAMYEIVATRKIGEHTWNWIKWTGNWESGAMPELTKALDEACQTMTTDLEGDQVRESGMHLDKSSSPYKLYIRADFMNDLDEVITQPIFADAFTPKARVSKDTIDAIHAAFSDAEGE